MNRQRLMIAITAVLVIGIIVYSYFAFYRPAAQSVELNKQAIRSEQQLIEALEASIAVNGEAEPLPTGRLQERVPVAPLEDQLLLAFEKAELLSGVLVTSYAFSDSGVVSAEAAVDGEQAGEAEADGMDLTVDVDGEGVTVNTGEEPADVTTPDPLPAGVNQLLIQLSVQSDDYEELHSFLEEIERETRLLTIEEITFEGPPEVTAGQDDNTQQTSGNAATEAVVVLSAYYMPDLTSLLDDLPAVDTPYPAEKNTPFAPQP